MRAMVLEHYNSDLMQRVVEDPEPSDLDIVIAVRACGICHTDVKIVTGQLPASIILPHIPGHEIAGEVVEVGRGVKDIHVGDKGVVYCLVTCGTCELCRTGRENLCFSIRRLGFELPGGFADLVRLPAANFCVFESDIPFEQMAILPDAVATPFHAMEKLARLGMGQRVLIVGIGGLGIHAVQIAVKKGAEVIAADINDSALDLAMTFGAAWRINTAKEVPLEKIREISHGGGVDLVIDGVGRRETVEWSLRALKKGGHFIAMGYDPVNPVPFPMLDMHNNEWTIHGTKASTRQELKAVIHAVERGQIRPVISRRIPFESVNEGLALIRKGEAQGRTVLVKDA